MQSNLPQFIHRCQNEVYKTEKYFHRKVGSSSVLYPTVSTTVGTLRSRPPRQMALESSLVKPALSVRSRGAPGGDTLGRTLRSCFSLSGKPFGSFPVFQ